MVEAAARSRGYRANGGRACPVKASNPGDSIAAALPPRDEVGPTAPIGPTTTCTLSRIVDGDTVYCDPIGAIRLIGIDAPEHNLSPHFARATGALTALVPLGASLVVESDVQDRDRYDRRLGHLWYNGQLINWYMVRNGWAAAYRYPPSVRYAEPLDSAATWARAEQRGLWPDGGIPCRGNTKSRKTC
jgi:micrococcal nuclease